MLKRLDRPMLPVAKHDCRPLPAFQIRCHGRTFPTSQIYTAETDCMAGHIVFEVRRETGKE
jgi:hypothetical protein